MQQLLKLERPKTSPSSLPDFLKQLFSLENPLEFVKQTISLSKNVRVDEETATLELEKKINYGILTMEMNEEGELVYSMKKIFKKAGLKLVYDLKPPTELPVIGIETFKTLEPVKLINPLTPHSPTKKHPTIPISDFITSPKDVFTYAINRGYMVSFEVPEYIPTYQEKFDPLNKNMESLERTSMETDIEPPHIPIDMIKIPLSSEILKLDPDFQSIKEYKRTGFQIERYSDPQILNNQIVYQRIILDNNVMIPGVTVYNSSIDAGLELETSYNKIWGTLVESVNGIKSGDGEYWGFFVNGVPPRVAADKYRLKEGDVVEWRLVERDKGSCIVSPRRSDVYSKLHFGLPEIIYD